MGDSETLTEIQHTEVATGRTYEALAEAFEHELGHLDPLTGVRLIAQMGNTPPSGRSHCWKRPPASPTSPSRRQPLGCYCL